MRDTTDTWLNLAETIKKDNKTYENKLSSQDSFLLQPGNPG